MTQYTQGPLSVNVSSYHAVTLADDCRNTVAAVYTATNDQANAARLVACWNACEGMADPAAELATLRAQRDALRDAAQYAFDHEGATGTEAFKVRTKLRMALERAK